MRTKKIKYCLLLAVLLVSSCKSFLEPASQSEYVPKLIKSLDELLLGEAYMGPYSIDANLFGILGLFDDDVAIRQQWANESESETSITQIRLAYTWSKDMKDQLSGYNTYGELYKKIAGCNAVLDYVGEVIGTTEEKNRVVAQALGLRAYYYWFLVNLYGQPYSYDRSALGVPLKLTSELSDGSMPRNTVDEVYRRIESDLLEAEERFKTLPKHEWSATNNRINLAFVQLMLSRVYLYMEQWEDAMEYGQRVITDYNYQIWDLNALSLPSRYNTPAYRNFITWDNPEVIFLMGNWYNVLNLPFLTQVYGGRDYGSQNLPVASIELVDAYDDTDLRKAHYLIVESVYGSTALTGYRKAFSKFEVGYNYLMSVSSNSGHWGTAFKVTEAYLNVAEAAAMIYKESGQSDKLDKALSLLNGLRSKRIISDSFEDVAVTDPDELIDFIRDERRRELCFENHRWFDIRRYGMEQISHIWYDESGNAMEYKLEKNDPGFVLQIPNEAFEYNSALVQNEPKK